jgi:hypothetical protein
VKLDVHSPYIEARVRDVTEAAASFAFKHKPSLRSFLVSLEGVNLGEEEVRGAEGPTLEVKAEDLAGLHLTSCTLHSAGPGHVSMRPLNQILEAQTNLRSLYSTTGYTPLSTLAQCIQSSAQTLTSLQLSVRGEGNGTGIHLHGLQACTGLRVLALLGPPKEVVGDHELFPANQDDIPAARKTADLHGAIFLPASLEVVKIYNLFMTSGDTKSLAEGKPALRVLKLKDTGRLGNLGFRLEDALKIIGKRQLRSISWSQCFNVKSILEAETGGAGDHGKFFCAIVVRHIRDGGFFCHKDKNGAYATGSGRSEPQVIEGENKEFSLNEKVFTRDANEEDEDEMEEEEEEEDEDEEGEVHEDEEIDLEEEDEDEEEEYEEEDEDGEEDMEVEDEGGESDEEEEDDE